MTLKERFNNLVPKEFGGMYEPLLSDCEKVADEYAIELAKWVEWYDFDGFKSKKELLEIFKKERGL